MALLIPSLQHLPRTDATDGVRNSNVAFIMVRVAQSRGWAWPGLSAAVGFTCVFVLASVHRLIDLGTYLLGGGHALKADLYHVLYAPTHLGFTYPPFAALLFWPLSHLPLRYDQITFTCLSFGALIALIAVVLRVTCPTLDRRTIAWWSLLLVTPIGLLDPVRETLLLGQVNVFLALAVIADMTLVSPNRRGYLVGIAAAIKLTPLILVPYLLFTGQRRSCLRAVGTFIGVEAATAILVPRDSWTYWTHYVWKPSSAGWLPWVGNQGVVGVADRVAGHTVASTTMYLLVALISVAGLLIAIRAYREISPLLGFLIVEATESMASPVSWSHHFIWVILLIAWLGLSPERPSHRAWWALLAAMVFWAAPFWWVPHGASVRYAGQGWLTPLADSFFIVSLFLVLATGIRIVTMNVATSRSPTTITAPGASNSRSG